MHTSDIDTIDLQKKTSHLENRRRTYPYKKGTFLFFNNRIFLLVSPVKSKNNFYMIHPPPKKKPTPFPKLVSYERVIKTYGSPIAWVYSVLLCTDCKKNNLKRIVENVPVDFKVLPTNIIQVNPSTKTKN